MTESTQERPQRSRAEWGSFVIALSLIAILIGLVAYNWLTKNDEPPILSVSQTQPLREAGGQFYVSFKVTNTGGETAESVQVMAELRVNGEVIETGEQQIDFLSGGEENEGAFVFTQNPQKGELILRVASYKLP